MQQPPSNNQQPPFYYGTPPQMGAYQPGQQNWQPMQQPPKKKSKLPAIGCAALILLVILIVVMGASASSNTGASVPAQARQSTGPIKLTTTVKSMPATPVIAGNPAKAILAGSLADFKTKYGKLNSFSDPARGEFYFALYGNDKDDLTVQFTYNKHADAIIYDAQESKLWDYTQAKNACLPFLPSDAAYQRKMTIYDPTGNAQDEQLVYVSSSMAHLFPDDAFTDEKGNNTKPGTIGLILSHWDTNTYLTCIVQIGLES